MSRRRVRALLTVALLCMAYGCGTETELVRLSGTWQGSVTLPDAFSTSMTLSQTNGAATGTMTISGRFVGSTVTGSVNESNRTFSWSVFNGCEAWTGLLTVSAGGDEMSGTVFADLSDCSPPGTDLNGTMTLTRQ